MTNIVEQALAEDIGEGDITTNLCVSPNQISTATIIAREKLILSGAEILEEVFVGHALACPHKSGAELNPGDTIATIQAPTQILLTRERTALNFLQRLSGVATLTRQYVESIKHTTCRILDTRKTTPGLRILEKAATRAGGATNHRMGLYDAILIKNNHITAAGGVRQALEKTRETHLPVEIEVRTKEELDQALTYGAKHLLLDNLTPTEAKAWIKHIDHRATVELSGNINLETVRAYAETGADYISVGAITHSARAVDINFRISVGHALACPPTTS
ncbi:MAG: carboxylating nicotinate-nucleotide diphosphorylase [Acidobacteriota bacterium]|nr:carboxylating nicotinate-nucleotide diphosphorylase [Acidobacteriota bacterium]